ncbi:MAG: hypothetical protein U5L11_05255 [Arhodomonas sp.]|nr:hypothetical protein [Arhodomonas sp.]
MNRKSLERRLTYLAGRAVREYRMIEEGDRIMVCLSGARIPTPCWRCCGCCSAAPRCASSWWR